MVRLKPPKICRYCAGKVIYTSARAIYEKSSEMIYLCTNCNAYVGVHKGTRIPLGKLANAALRMKRRETHAVFDAFWHARGWTRAEAYRWLARELGIAEDAAHIGNFEMDECEQASHACRSCEQKESA